MEWILIILIIVLVIAVAATLLKLIGATFMSIIKFIISALGVILLAFIICLVSDAIFDTHIIESISNWI